MGLPARIRPVRRRTRRVGSGRFHVHRRFIVQRQRQHRRVSAGAASTAKSFKSRPKNVASAKVNVIRPRKKRSDIAKISAGAASTVTSFKSMPRNVKSAAGSVIPVARKRSGIADNSVGAASMARSCSCRWRIAAKETVNVLARAKRRPEIVAHVEPQLRRRIKLRPPRSLTSLAFNQPRRRRGAKLPRLRENVAPQLRRRRLLENLKGKGRLRLRIAANQVEKGDRQVQHLTANPDG